MKQLIQDKNNKLCAAKIIAVTGTIIIFVKILMVENPSYLEMAGFLSPLYAVYFGRSYTKSMESIKDVKFN